MTFTRGDSPTESPTTKDLLELVLAEAEIDVVLQARPYTAVRLKLSLCEGTGFSKVMTGDEWDSKKGYDIAKRRAARRIAQQVCADAEGIKDAYDHVWYSSEPVPF